MRHKKNNNNKNPVNIFLLNLKPITFFRTIFFSAYFKNFSPIGDSDDKLIYAIEISKFSAFFFFVFDRENCIKM